MRRGWVVLAMLAAMSCKRAKSREELRPDAAPQVRLELVDAAWVRAVLDKKGPSGVIDKLYVSPPDLWWSIDQGIASGAKEWLEIYDRLRAALPEPTRDDFDRALARALVPAAERVLRYLHDHPDPRVVDVCGRATSGSRVTADVADGPALLEILRRSGAVAAVRAPELEKEKAWCLDAL